MRIPSYSKKIAIDFETYLNEFQASFRQNTEEHRGKSRRELFKSAYPLFVLLESLADADFFANPSTEIIISEAFFAQEEAIKKRQDALLHNNHREVSIQNSVIEKTQKTITELSRNLYVYKNAITEDQALLQKGLRRTQFTPYFYELYSDTLLLLDAYYINNYRGAYIALRTILEDIYRHLYYKDHPEEFYAIQNHDCDEHDFGLSPQKFREYLPQTSFLKRLCKMPGNFADNVYDNKGDTVFAWNKSLYSRTSAYVHASKVEFMGKFKKNFDMNFSEEASRNLIDTTKDVVTLSVIFLVCAYRAEFLRLNDYAKSLILLTFDKETRHNFRKQLNV
jgi:hypothetical protein